MPQLDGLLITGIHPAVLGVSAHSNWVILVVATNAGVIGLGEATLEGQTDLITAQLAAVRPRLVGAPVGELRSRSGAMPMLGLIEATIASALDQAYWDILARTLETPLHQVLGAEQGTIPVYANINRSLDPDRSAAAFARQAAAAVAAGFTSVKCAPFDGFVRDLLEEPRARALFDAGLERVAAVRSAIGSETHLMIDCHWRFDTRTALTAIAELEQFNPYWIEAPVTEHDPDAWAMLRRRTDRQLAGGEMLTGSRSFAEFMDRAGVDVVMPDVRHAGGVSGLTRIGAIAASRGVRVAPHNPGGPVATAASGHVSLALETLSLLELPWGEADRSAAVLTEPLKIVGSRLHLSGEPGLGIGLRDGAENALPPRTTTPILDQRVLWT